MPSTVSFFFARLSPVTRLRLADCFGGSTLFLHNRFRTRHEGPPPTEYLPFFFFWERYIFGLRVAYGGYILVLGWGGGKFVLVLPQRLIRLSDRRFSRKSFCRCSNLVFFYISSVRDDLFVDACLPSSFLSCPFFGLPTPQGRSLATLFFPFPFPPRHSRQSFLRSCDCLQLRLRWSFPAFPPPPLALPPGI